MQAGISKGGPQPTVPSVLLPEILSFSPHFLLDDIVNIANHAVGDTVDAMEKFIVRWADERTSEEWDSTQDLEQGLVAFQTLLEFHTDIAFDFFEAWSLRNIFAIPADLPIVVPHQAGLDLEQPPGKEAELLGEIEELRRKIDNSRRLERCTLARSAGAGSEGGHGRGNAGGMAGSEMDWIVPKARRELTVGERLQPTIDSAIKERDRAAFRAKMSGLALNIAIGLQVLLGALTTGLGAALTGKSTSVAISILGGASTLVASYLARARGSNEPEASLLRVQGLEHFLREASAFKLDHGHEIGIGWDRELDGFRGAFEGMMGHPGRGVGEDDARGGMRPRATSRTLTDSSVPNEKMETGHQPTSHEELITESEVEEEFYIMNTTPIAIDSRSAGDRRTIRAIPTEVLCQIFRAAKDIQRFTKLDDVNGRYPSFDQITISHVCRQWRDNALGLPELWTSLLIVRDSYLWDRIETFLERSKSQPLDIIIRWCPRKYRDELDDDNVAVPILAVFSVLILHSHRWRSLDLVADTGTAVNFALALFRPLRVPLLRRLNLKYITAKPNEVAYRPWTTMNRVIPFELFGARLEELSVGSAFIDWDPCILTALDFTRLKSLNLASIWSEYSPTLPQLFTILSKCPNLTMLACHVFRDEEPVQIPSALELPALLSLELTWGGPSGLAFFLRHLCAPNLRSFSLIWAYSWPGSILNLLMERPLGLDWVPTPLPATPSLLQNMHAVRMRTILSSGTPEQWRVAFYERLRNVRALVLENRRRAWPNGKDLQTALSDLIIIRVAPNHTVTGIAPAVLLPHLTTLVLMTPEAGILRPFVAGRRNAGVPLRRLFADFAPDHSKLEIEWLKQNLEVVGTVEKFLENGEGNVETWLALDTEPVGTARFVELCADVSCVVSPGPA
ncbi:hypothetical protein EWM64_g8852 [Hericium alpestre]|uniref:SMODS and SLOG-associating 2TM effector domain-containing protein n=1 Tax=Hericium alpestre TaxID=135208 RepID=A0A4Y9ZMU2_9AGAM|nr:hypothetical protein EWM64_g8852 [Hericium alpestre]